MGTLTGCSPYLAEYCIHKLPTSCRLSSILNCCACADERAHAASYSTYIDGVGFVLRGNRWQRYCWYCKEFWAERVRVSGLRSGQTRIPEEPDQSEFLDKWYDFWRGYRSVKHEDGREERIAVLGEDFKEVSPGCLPRTLDELRAGARREEQVQRTHLSAATTSSAEAGPTLDETLNELFAQAEVEDRQELRSSAAPADPPAGPLNVHAQAMNPTSVGSRNREYQARRVAALRRELNRMRSGIERVISGLQDLGEIGPDHTEATDAVRSLDSLLESRTIHSDQSSHNQQQTTASLATTPASSLESRISFARIRVSTARQERARVTSELGEADSELRESQQHLQHLQRGQRTMENYTRIFGTREEMQAQGESYESPIGGMFTRAMDRFRAAETVRREQRTLRRVLEDETAGGGEEEIRRLAELEAQERDVWGVPRPQQAAEQFPPPISGRLVTPAEIMERRRIREQLHRGQATGERHDRRRLQPIIIADAHGQALTFDSRRDRNEDPTPPALADTTEESMLEEYYGMLRQHGWNSEWDRDETEVHTGEGNFPQSMLHAIRTARERELTERADEHVASVNNPGRVEVHEDEDFSETAAPNAFHLTEDEWWHADAEHLIRALTHDEVLRVVVDVSSEDAAAMLSYFVDGIVSEQDRTTIDGLMQNPRAIWTAGLPMVWVSHQTAISEDLRTHRQPELLPKTLQAFCYWICD